MRYSGSHSGGTSFTSSIQQSTSSGGHLGSLQADASYSDYTARSFGATLTLQAELRFEDYDLEACIFQDLDGDEEYSPGADRLLAKSTAANRDATSRQLSLTPISFTFQPRHEPVGICWVIQSSAGIEYTTAKMFR
jgi:hypothetical protein